MSGRIARVYAQCQMMLRGRRCSLQAVRGNYNLDRKGRYARKVNSINLCVRGVLCGPDSNLISSDIVGTIGFNLLPIMRKHSEYLGIINLPHPRFTLC